MSEAQRILVLGLELGFGEGNTLIAAARALAAAGHAVTFAATPRLAARARTANLHAVEVGSELTSGEPTYWDTVRETLLDVHRGPRRWLDDAVAPVTEVWLARCRDLVGDADLIVAGSLAPFASTLAREACIPWLRIARAPEGLGPEAPPELVPWLATRIADAKLPAWMHGLVARARKVRARSDAGPAPTLRLAAFSPVLAVARQEGPSAVVQIGALHHDASAALDPTLVDFLDAGSPPLLLTLGSTPSVYRPGAIHDAFAEALDQLAGARGVLLVADALVDTLRPRFESDRLRVAGYTPYRPLMARCCAVVHHGGAGPVAHALEAGLPSLVVAHAAYQRAHARRVSALGVGHALAPAALTASSLGAALRALLDDAALAARAAELGARVRAEDPQAALVTAVRALPARTPRQSLRFAAASGSRPVSTRISL